MSVVTSTPYDTAGAVLNTARSISADAATANGLEGDILNDDQPYVYPVLAKCYRDLQDELISFSVETFSKYGHIYAIPPTLAANQRTQVNISFVGYWDGQTVNADCKLPPDMIKPLELWECPTGQQAWTPMVPVPDSISSRPPRQRFNVWDFQNDRLILPGCSLATDIKLKYLCYAPDLTDKDSQVYILHCQTALANKVVSAVSKMLGGLEMAGIFEKDADKAVALIVNRTARREAYVSYQRKPFRNRGHR